MMNTLSPAFITLPLSVAAPATVRDGGRTWLLCGLLCYPIARRALVCPIPALREFGFSAIVWLPGPSDFSGPLAIIRLRSRVPTSGMADTIAMEFAEHRCRPQWADTEMVIVRTWATRRAHFCATRGCGLPSGGQGSVPRIFDPVLGFDFLCWTKRSASVKNCKSIRAHYSPPLRNASSARRTISDSDTRLPSLSDASRAAFVRRSR